MDDITFSYEIDLVGVHLEYKGKKNVIYEIRSTLFATNSKGGSYSGIIVTAVPTKDLSNFIEYEKIDKNHLLHWIATYSESTIQSVKESLVELHYPKKVYLKPDFK